MIEKNIQVKSYNRKVTYSKVTWSCLWCGQSSSDERFPGSFVPVLCAHCRTLYRSWQRANYYRRDRGLDFQPLRAWVDERKELGKDIPDINEHIEKILDSDDQQTFHTPANNSTAAAPISGSRFKISKTH